MTMKTESRIQQAAIRLVLQHGYDKTTMEDIAQEAGVARSTIYTKWKTKEDLFAALLKAEALQFAVEWYRRVEADPEGGTFAGIYKNSLLAMRANPFIQALYTQNRRVLGSFIHYEHFAQLMGDRLIWLTTLLQMMQAEGLIRRDVDAGTLAQVAVTFRQGLFVSEPGAPGSGTPGYEETIDLFTAMFRQYIAAQDSPTASDTGKRLLKAMVDRFLAAYSAE